MQQLHFPQFPFSELLFFNASPQNHRELKSELSVDRQLNGLALTLPRSLVFVRERQWVRDRLRAFLRHARSEPGVRGARRERLERLLGAALQSRSELALHAPPPPPLGPAALRAHVRRDRGIRRPAAAHREGIAQRHAHSIASGERQEARVPARAAGSSCGRGIAGIWRVSHRKPRSPSCGLP